MGQKELDKVKIILQEEGDQGTKKMGCWCLSM